MSTIHVSQTGLLETERTTKLKQTLEPLSKMYKNETAEWESALPWLRSTLLLSSPSPLSGATPCWVYWQMFPFSSTVPRSVSGRPYSALCSSWNDSWPRWWLLLLQRRPPAKRDVFTASLVGQIGIGIVSWKRKQMLQFYNWCLMYLMWETLDFNLLLMLELK